MAVPAELAVPAVICVVVFLLYLLLKALESWYNAIAKKEDRGKNFGLGFLYLLLIPVVLAIIFGVMLLLEKK